MTAQNSDPSTDEAEDNPEGQAAVRKVKIAIAVMGLILVLGFIAFGFAIVYKLTRSEPQESSRGSIDLPVAGCVLDLPPDDQILSTAMDEDRYAVTVARGEKRRLLLFSLNECRLIAEIKLGN